ncbi:hypothetical protein EYF80_064099 [Liparis tanakae]|uniref:Uncharacterized protein n=1 Tax=Liparis tanakae TaxID=230148 RepID=A0A4Z2EAC6_9TELE|nr:hypothetical protein EYF80_064099 [Liparis tanakae]
MDVTRSVCTVISQEE